MLSIYQWIYDHEGPRDVAARKIQKNWRIHEIRKTASKIFQRYYAKTKQRKIQYEELD